MNKNKKVQVCDKCLKASCWYGEFMCEYSFTAGTTIRTVRELEKLNLEHSDYWSDATMEKIYGETDPFTDT